MRPNGSMFRCLGLVWLVLGACTAGEEQVAPPKYDFYFPTGMALSPDERFLFVLNANADLRYDSGTVQVIDLDQVDQVASRWAAGQATTDCVRISDRARVLSCPTTKDDGSAEPWVVAGASVKVGGFGAGIAVEPLKHGAGASTIVRVFATVRGDPSVTYMDFDTAARTMSCGASGDFPKCGQTNRLARFRNDPDLTTLGTEPFFMSVDPALQFGYVTHLGSGIVTLVYAPTDDTQAPMLMNSIATLWSPNRASGALGAVGVAPRMPGDPNGLVYVTSRAEARVATMSLVKGNPLADGTPTADLVRGPSFFYNGINEAGDVGDARGIAFTPDGNRAFVVNRTPPALHMIDTSLDAFGAPRNTFLTLAEVCRQPAMLALADFGAGLTIAVPCFGDGQTWFFDGRTLDLVGTEDTGRGPDGIVASVRRKKIYIANYAEDTLAVIDATPGSPTQNREVLRLGHAREVSQ